MKEFFESIRKDSRQNLKLIKESIICGCFHCLAIFDPSEIVGWIDGGKTALCPKCGIDSVLGSPEGSIDRDMLQKMQEIWFKKSENYSKDEWQEFILSDSTGTSADVGRTETITDLGQEKSPELANPMEASNTDLAITHCCAAMMQAVAQEDMPVNYWHAFREYGFRLLGESDSVAVIGHCPWCGTRLPESLRDMWYAELERRGLDPNTDDLPDDFRNDTWHEG